MNTQCLIETITAENLLQIPTDEPERLFHKDTLRLDYGMLLKRFHPDGKENFPNTTEALMHLECMYEKAKEKIERNIWENPNSRTFFSSDGKIYEISYHSRKNFELGEIFISNTVITYVIDNKNRDLVESAIKKIESFSFADDKMKTNIQSYLPKIKIHFETLKNALSPSKIVVIFQKNADYLSLADVLAYFDGHLDPRHTAWILTRLHNIACYLQWANISHNDISANTVFISPLNHSVLLLGGWWYTNALNSKFTALPSRTMNALPSLIKTHLRASPIVDKILIRLLGREMLEDTRGLNPHNSPQPLVDWLRLSSDGNAFLDYDQWSKIREKSFGKQKFIKMDISAKNLYT